MEWIIRKILFIRHRWMKRCYTRRRVDNATLFFFFLSFSNVLRSHEHLQPRRHSIVQRERKDRDTDIQQSGRSRVPIQSRNEVDPLYKYTWRKKKRKRKENRISLLRGNPLARFPPDWNRVAVYTREYTASSTVGRI